MTDSPRQLPGVKGQWILCSDCPPTAADADKDGDVQIYSTYVPHRPSRYKQLQDVLPIEYWRPPDSFDTRPFTLEAASPVGIGRKIVQVAIASDSCMLAVADDGSAWERSGSSLKSLSRNSWKQLPPLPTTEA